MRTAHRLAVLAVAAIGNGVAIAQDSPSAAAQIYQQRTADGRIVLSDRPVTGAQTQRTWQFAPVDMAAAQQRREVARREAEAVSERIQRQLDREQQRANALALEQLRLAQAQAQRDAERVRYEQREPAVVLFVPRRVPHIVPPFPPPRVPRFPRPGPPEPRMKDHPAPVLLQTRG